MIGRRDRRSRCARRANAGACVRCSRQTVARERRARRAEGWSGLARQVAGRSRPRALERARPQGRRAACSTRRSRDGSGSASLRDVRRRTGDLGEFARTLVGDSTPAPNSPRPRPAPTRTLWNAHVLPRLGAYRLRDLRPTGDRAVFAQTSGRRRRRRLDPKDDGVTPGRVSNAPLSGMCPGQPARLVRKPTGRRQRAINVLSPARVERLRHWFIAREPTPGRHPDIRSRATRVCGPEKRSPFDGIRSPQPAICVDGALADGAVKSTKTGTGRTVLPARHARRTTSSASTRRSPPRHGSAFLFRGFAGEPVERRPLAQLEATGIRVAIQCGRPSRARARTTCATASSRFSSMRAGASSSREPGRPFTDDLPLDLRPCIRPESKSSSGSRRRTRSDSPAPARQRRQPTHEDRLEDLRSGARGTRAASEQPTLSSGTT